MILSKNINSIAMYLLIPNYVFNFKFLFWFIVSASFFSKISEIRLITHIKWLALMSFLSIALLIIQFPGRLYE